MIGLSDFAFSFPASLGASESHEKFGVRIGAHPFGFDDAGSI
jgi:hypothetical protein